MPGRVGPWRLSGALLPTGVPGWPPALHRGERAGQEAQSRPSGAPGRARVGGGLRAAHRVPTATTGRAAHKARARRRAGPWWPWGPCACRAPPLAVPEPPGGGRCAAWSRQGPQGGGQRGGWAGGPGGGRRRAAGRGPSGSGRGPRRRPRWQAHGEPRLGWAWDHPDPAPGPPLAGGRLQRGEKQPAPRCGGRQGAVLGHGQAARRPRWPLPAPRRQRGWARRLTGRDQRLPRVEGPARAIPPRPRASLQRGTSPTSPGSCLLSLERDSRGASYQKDSGINSIGSVTCFRLCPVYSPTPLVLRIIRHCTLRIYWTSSLIHLARDSLVPQALFPFVPGCVLP